MIVLHTLSFPFIIFIRMMKTFNVERRLLLILYSTLTGLMALLLIFKFVFFGGIEKNEESIYFILEFVILFVISNLMEGTTHLLSNKIIPSFVKICYINNRYIISYSSVFGKILGGLIFCILCLIEGNNTPFKDTYIFRFNSLIFSIMTIISFIIFVSSYKKLRVRAIAKLLYISDWMIVKGKDFKIKNILLVISFRLNLLCEFNNILIKTYFQLLLNNNN